MRWLAPALAAAVAACAGPPLPPEEPKRSLEPGVAPIIFHTLNRSLPVETRRQDLTETLHGQLVADPYRWLEDDDSEEVRTWTQAQNDLLQDQLSRIGERSRLHARLVELLGIGDVTHPAVRRTGRNAFRYFYRRREAGQDHAILYVRDGLAGEDRVLLDPNQLSTDKTTSLDWYFPSRDGSLLAYGLSEGGSEESTLFVRNVATGKDLPDKIERTRYSSVCWRPDNRGFYYARYPEPGSVPEGEESYHRKIFDHVLGSDPKKDPLVYEASKMTHFPSCQISPDGRWLLVSVHQGWSKNELFLADTKKKNLEFVELTTGKTQLYRSVLANDALYLRTNEGAPRYSVYRVDPARPARSEWKQIIREHATDVLDDITVVGGQVLASFMRDAASRLERFDATGNSLGPVALPSVGTSDGFSGVHDGAEGFFNFESFARPDGIWRLDLKTGKVDPWVTVKSPIVPDDFVVVTREAKSKDGTRVPYFVVHKKGLELDAGDHPTLLYGYGGFNVSLQPRFSRSNYALLERGVVYVQAILRGGGEFGEEWHRDGQLGKKQNVFDDFYAVAEHLIQSGVTTSERLAVSGRSNGGLLVATAVTQRPELFRVGISGVPLTDMLRYHRFLIAKLWIPEYGSPDDPEQFEWLHAYSPYHRVVDGTEYPAVLLTTAESDTRVHPMHARKMAAALQYATGSERPVLLRIETQAGHGAGKPVTKIADEHADVYAFLLWQLGLVAQAPGDPD